MANATVNVVWEMSEMRIYAIKLIRVSDNLLKHNQPNVLPEMYNTFAEHFEVSYVFAKAYIDETLSVLGF